MIGKFLLAYKLSAAVEMTQKDKIDSSVGKSSGSTQAGLPVETSENAEIPRTWVDAEEFHAVRKFRAVSTCTKKIFLVQKGKKIESWFRENPGVVRIMDRSGCRKPVARLQNGYVLVTVALFGP